MTDQPQNDPTESDDPFLFEEVPNPIRTNLDELMANRAETMSEDCGCDPGGCQCACNCACAVAVA